MHNVILTVLVTTFTVDALLSGLEQWQKFIIALLFILAMIVKELGHFFHKKK